MQNNNNFTQTTNGAKAYTLDSFLIDEQHAISGINESVITKNDYKNSLQFLNKIFTGKNKISKVYAFILIFHIRNIEFGKGLRLPFYESLMYLYQNGYKDLVKACISQIPTHGYFKDLCQLYLYADKAEATDLQQIISDVYCKELKKEYDLKISNKMTNCAKFAPRMKKKFSIFALKLSKDMFPESKTPQKDYRKFLQEVMNKYKQVTEVLMTANRWDQIDPKFVPSLCYQKYKKNFLNHETDDKNKKILLQNYRQYIKKALENKDGVKINAKRLTIDQIIENFLDDSAKTKLQEDALEAQMMDIVKDMKKNGKILDSCVAVCDVSGSMLGTPLYACIGLGLIINQLNKGNYSNSLITFDSYPRWIKLGDCLTYKEQVQLIQNSPWDYSTDFYQTMKMIAELTNDKDKLPKIVFVFSDMQFNKANIGNSWENDTYKEIESYYHQKGFNSEDIPIIVFWNLEQNGVKSFTVDCKQKGVICISGFSQSLLKAITRAPDQSYLKNLSPFTFLIETLDNDIYVKIKEIGSQYM